MKIELIKEENISDGVWYHVVVNDTVVKCQRNYEDAIAFYEKVKLEKNVEPIKTILISEEI